MAETTKKQQCKSAISNLRVIKNRRNVDECPSRTCCVNIWGGEELFSEIRNLTKFELIFEQGEMVYEAGKPVTSLYVVQSGAVKLEKKVEDDISHISGFYFSGDIIGLDSIGHEQYNYNAFALIDTWVCEIRLDKLLSRRRSATAIQKRLNSLLSIKLREIDEHLYKTRYLYSEQRLLNFFKMLCAKNLEKVDGNKNLYKLPMMKSDIANFLGMRSETLSRSIRQLEIKGVVSGNFPQNTLVINRLKVLPKTTRKRMG
jgi:CRP/FNR family transcriptional regulator